MIIKLPPSKWLVRVSAFDSAEFMVDGFDDSSGYYCGRYTSSGYTDCVRRRNFIGPSSNDSQSISPGQWWECRCENGTHFRVTGSDPEERHWILEWYDNGVRTMSGVWGFDDREYILKEATPLPGKPDFIKEPEPDAPKKTDGRFEVRAAKVGRLVDQKNAAYGNSAAKTGAILRELYPDGLRPDQYDDALLVVRILDKLSRIAQRGVDGRDLGGESPYQDIAGYGLLGMVKDEGVR